MDLIRPLRRRPPDLPQALFRVNQEFVVLGYQPALEWARVVSMATLGEPVTLERMDATTEWIGLQRASWDREFPW
jgi:hypothetical protein